MKNFNIIVACDENNGIGKDCKLPWINKEDMKYFMQETLNSIIIMGRNTWESINCKQLKHRRNIVITSKQVNCESYNSLNNCLYNLRNENKAIYIIGGSQLYEEAIKSNYCKNILLTKVKGTYECDKFFPCIPSTYYKINYAVNTAINTFIVYKRVKNNKIEAKTQESQYLELVAKIMQDGELITGRNGVTKSIFGAFNHCFDLCEGFPLLTTKKMPFYMIVKELLFFLHGYTDSKILAKQGVNIWEKNTSKKFLAERNLNYCEGDMGPMYGWNWRHFGAEYISCEDDYAGHDQLKELLHNIMYNPGRRLLLTTYDPSKVSQSVLPPCHGLITQFNVREGKYLDCKTYQRSADIMLGYPFNIASYALLTHIIAKVTNLIAGKLYISLGDAHIYEEHFSAAIMQINREPLKLPTISINTDTSVCTSELSVCTALSAIEALTYKDFILHDYISHDAIKLEMKE